MNMETEFDALAVESEEESAGSLIRRSSKDKYEKNLKENDDNKTLKMEAEADEFSSLINDVEVEENTVQNGKENCSHGEVKTGKDKEAEASERTRFEETECHEKEELLGPEVSNGHFLSAISSNDTAVMTVPTNNIEPDKTQAKAMLEWSEYVVKEEGLWKCRHCSWVYPVMNPRVELIQKHKEHCQTMNTIQTLFEKGFPINHNIQEGSESRALLEKGKVIDYKNKDTELVKDEIVIQTMADVSKNQPSVSQTIMQNSQDGFVRAQDETQLSDQWSRTLENSASIGKVEEIVRVLKEQQSHDLLCPVCGSCITKRVILRKRKRINTISIDRWIQEPVDDAQAAFLEGSQQITEDENDQPESPHEDIEVTEAYGCLACFSIFFQRVVGVRHLLTKSESVKESLADQEPSSILHDMRDISDKDKESFYCLPFRNTWRKNSKKEPRPGNQLKEPLLVEPTNEALDNKVSRALEESSSYGTLQSGNELKEPLLVEPTNEALDNKGSGALEESSSHGTLQSAAAKAIGSSLSNEVKDSHGIATQSISYQTSITVTKTLAVLSSMENVGSKQTLFTLPEATDITQDVNGSDKSSQSKEQFPPAKRSEDQLAELHLDDSARLHAKHIEEKEHSKTETPDGDASIILPDVVSSNIETCIQENVGSKKTYTLTEATNIPKYVNVSDKSSQLKEELPHAKRSEDQLAELHLDDSARLHAKLEEQEQAKTETTDGDASIILPDVLASNIETSVQENVGSTETNYTHTESTNITQNVNVSDKSSQLKEHFPPAKRSEDNLAELHSDVARLHVKRQEQEHVNIKMPVGGASIILPDVLLSNKETSIKENAGSKKTKYTLTESTNITQYVNVSDKSSQLKERFSLAKSSEDQLAELHSDDARLHAKREEQEHANTKTPIGGASITLLDVLPRYRETNIEDMGIREDSPTYDQESNNLSAAPRDEELQQHTAAQKDASSKTAYMCNCIPISIQSVWSIWSLKESITDDKESEIATPLLSAHVESSSILTKQKPTPLHSKKRVISTNVTVPPVQTVIEVEPVDGSQPSEAATTVPELTRVATAQPQATEIVTEWDLLKSIVYGGLTVSLTSLGVVSSTAGGDAKTLTVIAICLSNLVAGLFVILNNMLDLDHYHKDQFIERVGHSFWFNGSVAIVSYFIFGSLAPITYALSFRKSDDRLYKFIATGAVSLVCIILLALGRARISNKSYIRTVTLYIVTGFWSAVAGFFAGEYINKLLEKWGI